MTENKLGIWIVVLAVVLAVVASVITTSITGREISPTTSTKVGTSSVGSVGSTNHKHVTDPYNITRILTPNTIKNSNNNVAGYLFEGILNCSANTPTNTPRGVKVILIEGGYEVVGQSNNPASPPDNYFVLRENLGLTQDYYSLKIFQFANAQNKIGSINMNSECALIEPTLHQFSQDR